MGNDLSKPKTYHSSRSNHGEGKYPSGCRQVSEGADPGPFESLFPIAENVEYEEKDPFQRTNKYASQASELQRSEVVLNRTTEAQWRDSKAFSPPNIGESKQTRQTPTIGVHVLGVSSDLNSQTQQSSSAPIKDIHTPLYLTTPRDLLFASSPLSTVPRGSEPANILRGPPAHVDDPFYPFANPTLMAAHGDVEELSPANRRDSQAGDEAEVHSVSVSSITVGLRRVSVATQQQTPALPRVVAMGTAAASAARPPALHQHRQSNASAVETSNASFSGMLLQNSVLPLAASTTNPNAVVYPMPVFEFAQMGAEGDYELLTSNRTANDSLNNNLQSNVSQNNTTHNHQFIHSGAQWRSSVNQQTQQAGLGVTTNQPIASLADAEPSHANKPPTKSENPAAASSYTDNTQQSIKIVGKESLRSVPVLDSPEIFSSTSPINLPSSQQTGSKDVTPTALSPATLDTLWESWSIIQRRVKEQEGGHEVILKRFFHKVMNSGGDHIRRLFAFTDLQKQERMLSAVILWALGHTVSDETIMRLGVLHAHLGVSKSDLIVFGKCFLEMLKEASGDQWRETYQTAWQEAINEICRCLGEVIEEADAALEIIARFGEGFYFPFNLSSFGPPATNSVSSTKTTTPMGSLTQGLKARHPSLGFGAAIGVFHPLSSETQLTNDSFDSMPSNLGINLGSALTGNLVTPGPPNSANNIFTSILSRRSSLEDTTGSVYRSADAFFQLPRSQSGNPVLNDSNQTAPTPPRNVSPSHQQLELSKARLIKWFRTQMFPGGKGRCGPMSLYGQIENIFRPKEGPKESTDIRTMKERSSSPKRPIPTTLDVDSITSAARVEIKYLEPTEVEYGFCRPPFMPQVWEYSTRRIELHGRILYVNLPDGTPSIVVDFRKVLSVERAEGDPANTPSSPFASPASREGTPHLQAVTSAYSGGNLRIRAHARQSSEVSTVDGTTGSLGFGSETTPSMAVASQRPTGALARRVYATQVNSPPQVSTPEPGMMSPPITPQQHPYTVYTLPPQLHPHFHGRLRGSSFGGSVPVGAHPSTSSNTSGIVVPQPPSLRNRLSTSAMNVGATPTSNAQHFTIRIDSHDGSLVHFLNFTSQTLCERWMVLLRRHHHQFSAHAPAPYVGDIVKLSQSIFSEGGDSKRLDFLPSDFEYLTLIGKGNYGKVVKVRHKASSCIYAMKIIQKTAFTHMRNVVEVRRERAILETVNSPFIVKFYGFFQSEERLYFLFDFLSGGELFYHTKCAPNHHFTEDTSRFYLAEIACALEHLRLRNIVHRDIKGDNFVLDADGHVVLTDFGFAKAVDKAKRNTATCGTLAYIAPEVLAPGPGGYGYEVDWWSLGVVLFTMLTGFFPFLRQSPPETAKAIVYEPLRFPATVELTHNARSLCRRLMHKNPQERITSLQALQAHPFFAGFDWDKLIHRQMTPPFVPDATGTNTKYFSSRWTQDKTAPNGSADEDSLTNPKTMKRENNVFSSMFWEQEEFASEPRHKRVGAQQGKSANEEISDLEDDGLDKSKRTK